MKILRQGSEEKLKKTSIKKPRIMIFECYWCGCKWEADIDKGEVQFNKWIGKYAICPFCKKRVLDEG